MVPPITSCILVKSHLPKMKHHARRLSAKAHPKQFLEAEIIHGLKPFVIDELNSLVNKSSSNSRLTLKPTNNPEAVRFHFQGNINQLNKLRTIMGLYSGQHYPIPRPKSLLGHQHFQQLLKQIDTIRRRQPANTFRTFRISAAGHQTAVFRRLKTEIETHTGLILNEDDADLLLRIRPAATQNTGWELLCRLTPRPHSTRWWRVAHMPGALNGPLATAMIALTDPQPNDCFLNLMCGSGTLLIERLFTNNARIIVGSDIQPNHLQKAQTNLATVPMQAHLLQQDDTCTSWPDQSFDVLVADLPWGQLVGTQQQIQQLYPRLMGEAARIAKPHARFVLITHQIRLIEKICQQQQDLWHIKRVVKLAFEKLHPRIYLLRRRP